MNRRIAVLAAMALPLMSCVGVYGPWGNDTGGIIPWSPEAEHNTHKPIAHVTASTQ